MCALIGQEAMFYQSIKHRKSAFYCFSPHYIRSLSRVLHCDKTFRTFQNTQEMYKLKHLPVTRAFFIFQMPVVFYHSVIQGLDFFIC